MSLTLSDTQRHVVEAMHNGAVLGAMPRYARMFLKRQKSVLCAVRKSTFLALLEAGVIELVPQGRKRQRLGTRHHCAHYIDLYQLSISAPPREEVAR